MPVWRLLDGERVVADPPETELEFLVVQTLERLSDGQRRDIAVGYTAHESLPPSEIALQFVDLDDPPALIVVDAEGNIQHD